jgi:hypothetical protein
VTTELGTELGTTLGTILSSMEIEGVATFDASKVYALAGLGNSIGYLTAAGGGEVGDAAGFGSATIYTLDALLPSAGNTGSLQGNYVFPTSGWAQQFTNPGASTTLNAVVINGAGGNVSAPSRTMLASDLGKVGVSAIQHTGTVLRSYADDGREIGTGSAIVGYTPSANPHRIGNRTTGGYTYGTELGWVTWRGTPTQPQIQALFAAVRTLGDFPSKAAIEALMPGTTVTHRWSLRGVLAAANVAVVDGSAAPAFLPDSVTGAANDQMTKQGAPLVRVIDPATPKLWSYETSPILYGSQAPAAVPGPDFWETATQLGETNGNSFWAAVFCQVVSQSVANQARDLLSSSSTTSQTGFSLRSNTLNTQLQFIAYDNALSPRLSPAAAVAASDVGKLQVYIAVYDQPALRLRAYFKRAEVSTGTVVTGYAPNVVDGLRIGQRYGTQLSNADGLAIYGVAGGLGLPSLAEIQAMYDATMATERIAAIPGKTSFRIDTTADAVGGALPSTLINREGAGFTFTKNGSPGTQAQYARAFGW